MIHIYRMYRLTNLINKENDKLIAKSYFQMRSSTQTTSPPPIDIKFITDFDAIEMFAKEHILFKKIGDTTATKILVSAYKDAYLSPSKKDKNEQFVIVTNKGLNFIDSIFTLKIGLWNAWYKEYGGLITFLTSGIATAIILLFSKLIWRHIT